MLPHPPCGWWWTHSHLTNLHYRCLKAESPGWTYHASRESHYQNTRIRLSCLMPWFVQWFAGSRDQSSQCYKMGPLQPWTGSRSYKTCLGHSDGSTMSSFRLKTYATFGKKVLDAGWLYPCATQTMEVCRTILPIPILGVPNNGHQKSHFLGQCQQWDLAAGSLRCSWRGSLKNPTMLDNKGPTVTMVDLQEKKHV